ncbi:MAG: hypothetical protein WC121_10690 [Candidatus Kapaibacterium sp.]
MREANRHRHIELDFDRFPNDRIWEMHPDESAKAFNYFVAYRDMGAGHRSLMNVATLFGVSEQAIAYYSSPCHWVKRVDAYEKHIDIELSKETIKNLKAMRKRHINNIRATETALMLPIKEVLTRVNDGRLKLEELDLSDLLFIVNKNASVLSKVVDTERKVNDQPNEIIQTHHEGAPQIVVIKPESNDRIREVLENRKRALEEE